MSRSPKNLQNRESTAFSEQATNFFAAIALIENVDEARDFLCDLLTEIELESISKRWCAARQLYEENLHADVQAHCKTSKNMVTRAKQAFYNYGTETSKMLHEKLKYPKGQAYENETEVL